MIPVTALAWTIAATVWAAILVLAGMWVLNRVFARYHSHGRAPAQEPPHHTPATAATDGTVHLPVVRDVVDSRCPIPHEGAVPGWSPLAEVEDVGLAPELTTTGEQMVADHRALAGISKAIDTFDEVIERALDELLRDLPKERMRLAASGQTTGEIDLHELEALLRNDGELVTS